MKNKLTPLLLLNLFATIFLMVSCSPVVDEKETTTQIPQTVSDVPKITVDELYQLTRIDNNLVIVDVRYEEEYIEAHIKGSISLPLAEINNKEWQLPHDKSLVLY